MRRDDKRGQLRVPLEVPDAQAVGRASLGEHLAGTVAAPGDIAHFRRELLVQYVHRIHVHCYCSPISDGNQSRMSATRPPAATLPW